MAGGNLDLVALGNPLLDMQIRDGEEVLKKYDLKSNDAILAEDKHQVRTVAVNRHRSDEETDSLLCQ
jgi:hypothetical protein